MDDLDYAQTLAGFRARQTVFSRYTLTRILGRGGMGVVWLARDEKLDQDVALKFLPELVANDVSALGDLKRETRRSLQLTHPHIVRIYDFVEDGRMAAVAMEFVDGASLTQRRMEQPAQVFSPTQLRPWLEQLCDALQYAHTKAKIAHRDLKPANLMVDVRGDLKVADFGISATLADTTTRASKQASSSGTPVYMSPQQMMGEKPAPTDDVYSLGATLYELLTGKPPFYTGNVLLQVQSKVPPSMAERREELGVTGADPIPPEWEQTVAACLSKEAAQRPQCAADVWARLNGAKVAGASATVAHDARPAIRAEATTGADPRSGGPRKFWGGWLVTGALMVAGGAWLYFGVQVPQEKREAELARRVAAAQADSQRIDRSRREAEAAAAVPVVAPVAKGSPAVADRAPVAPLGDVAVGGLVVRTVPAGADVSVGAVAFEKSPFTLNQLKVGKYPIRARLEGYEDWSGEIVVKPDEFSEPVITLTRSKGSVTLASTPTDVEVEIRIDGASPILRRTPASLELPTGDLNVVFRRQGWPELVRPVSVRRGATSEVKVAFVPGSVTLSSEPAGAEVFSQGKALGTTPLRLGETIPGQVQFELRCKGYKPAKATGMVESGKELALATKLERNDYPGEGERWTVSSLGLELIPINPGRFTMGSSNGESDQMPLTQVTLTQPFWIGKYEVTQGQFDKLMGYNPSEFKTLGANAPVENVSYDDALAFCRKLTESERSAGRVPEGYEYTLPTEAQWEYACRAGRGDGMLGDLLSSGWYAGNSSMTPHAVGGKTPNEWGVYDMQGNVWEWCLDWYHDRLPGGSVSDPLALPSDRFRYRTGRGGGWRSAADYCAPARRLWNEPTFHCNYLGFRVVLSPQR